MPGRRKDLRPKTGVGVPGSDAYNPQKTYTNAAAPIFSMGKQVRDGELAMYPNTPGSGQYHPDASINLVKTHSASWK